MVIKLARDYGGSKKTADSTAAGRGEKFKKEYYCATNLSANSGNWVLRLSSSVEATASADSFGHSSKVERSMPHNDFGKTTISNDLQQKKR